MRVAEIAALALTKLGVKDFFGLLVDAKIRSEVVAEWLEEAFRAH